MPDQDRRAILYCHGGGFIRKNAANTQLWACYSAYNFNAIYFHVNYGLPPANKAPGGGLNCYAGLKYMIENAAKWNIDPSKIALYGESAGGYLVACVSMELAQRNESHLVKFAWVDMAAVSNHWFERTRQNSTAIEWRDRNGYFNGLK